jgi:hypothetical protein
MKCAQTGLGLNMVVIYDVFQHVNFIYYAYNVWGGRQILQGGSSTT